MNKQESNKYKPTRWLTTSQAVDILGFNDTSLKRYMNSHKDYIDWKMVGRQYRINAESIPVIKQIRKLYESSYQRDEIESYLHNEGVPITITVDAKDKDNDDIKPYININDDIKNVKQVLHQQLRENEQLKHDISDNQIELLKENDQLKHDINELKESTASLLKEFRELKEVSEKSENKPWWSKLFGNSDN